MIYWIMDRIDLSNSAKALLSLAEDTAWTISSKKILSSELQISKSMLIFCCIREFSYSLLSGIFKK